MKKLTSDQVDSRKEKAVRFTRDVLGDSERADEIADESIESYAQRRQFEITNPQERSKVMARTKTKSELEVEVQDLQEENDELQEQLQTIADIVGGDDEDEEEDRDDETEGDNGPEE
jgi:hypothetical protein